MSHENFTGIEFPPVQKLKWLDIRNPGATLACVSRVLPEVWPIFEQVRLQRGKAYPDWPDFCCVPPGYFAEALRRDFSRVHLEDHNIDMLDLFATWRMTQGIYRFHPEAYAALVQTPVTGALPIEVFYQLPQWCVFIETPGMIHAGSALSGVYACLYYCPGYALNDTFLELISVYLNCTRITVVPLVPGMGIEEVFHLIAENIQSQPEAKMRALSLDGLNPTQIAAHMENLEQHLTEEISPILSLLLYLCSNQAQFRDARGSGRQPQNPTATRTKHGMRWFAPSGSTVWETGFPLGTALQQAREKMATEEPGNTHRASPAPHIRRAHWHAYWLGPLNEPAKRKLDVRWLPPIAVNVALADEGDNINY